MFKASFIWADRDGSNAILPGSNASGTTASAYNSKPPNNKKYVGPNCFIYSFYSLTETNCCFNSQSNCLKLFQLLFPILCFQPLITLDGTKIASVMGSRFWNLEAVGKNRHLHQ